MGEFIEIVALAVRFETASDEIRANSKHSKELAHGVIEKEVLAACSIHQEIRNIRAALNTIDFDMAVSKVAAPCTRTPKIPQLGWAKLRYTKCYTVSHVMGVRGFSYRPRKGRKQSEAEYAHAATCRGREVFGRVPIIMCT